VLCDLKITFLDFAVERSFADAEDFRGEKFSVTEFSLMIHALICRKKAAILIISAVEKVCKYNNS